VEAPAVAHGAAELVGAPEGHDHLVADGDPRALGEELVDDDLIGCIGRVPPAIDDEGLPVEARTARVAREQAARHPCPFRPGRSGDRQPTPADSARGFHLRKSPDDRQLLFRVVGPAREDRFVVDLGHLGRTEGEREIRRVDAVDEAVERRRRAPSGRPGSHRDATGQPGQQRQEDRRPPSTAQQERGAHPYRFHTRLSQPPEEND